MTTEAGSAARSRATLLILCVYVALIAVLIAYHEPWRDEADAWLVARDDGLIDILRLAGHSGTPGLWYFVQMPFAKTGLPYRTQSVINLVFMTLASWLLLRRSRVPLYVGVAALFGYYLSFEYAVVARNYGLGVLLGFLAIALDDWRERRPVAYGLLLVLLANVSAHFFFIAAALAGLWAVETAQARRLDARRVVAWIVVVCGFLGVVWQLSPAPGGQFPSTFFQNFKPWRFREVIFRSLYADSELRPLRWLANATYLAALLYLASRPRAFLLFLGGLAGLMYIYVFKYVGGLRHYGLVFVLLVMALWLAERETDADTTKWRWLRIKVPPRAAAVARIATYAGMLLALAIKLPMTVSRWRTELVEAFSRSRDAADALIEGGMTDRRIAAHDAPAASAILPYLPRHVRFWYPGIRDYGTHMLWDRAYAEGLGVGIDQAVAATKSHFPDWDKLGDGVLLILNEPLEDPSRHGYALRYRTSDFAWGMADEIYFIYEPIKRTPQ